MTYLFCLILGVVPSLIWLFYFLREDIHPEPKREITRVFLYGMVIAILAALIEVSFSKGISFLKLKEKTTFFLNLFLGVALVEEYLKYFVVKKKVFSSAEFDEPMDAPIYMITCALGFAAIENIIILSLFTLHIKITFLEKFIKLATLSYLRFLGATFLHALSSGIFGIFLAFSFFKLERKKEYTIGGLTASVLLHAIYNFSIIKLESFLRVGIIVISFFISILFIIFSFRKLKKMKGICKINL